MTFPNRLKKAPTRATTTMSRSSGSVRGIDLTEGYEGSFRNVSAATGAVFTVDLEVQETEEVEVPAGTFEAWKIRVRTDTVTQYMWVEAAAPHRLVKARVYGLQEVEYALTGGDEG